MLISCSIVERKFLLLDDVLLLNAHLFCAERAFIYLLLNARFFLLLLSARLFCFERAFDFLPNARFVVVERAFVFCVLNAHFLLLDARLFLLLNARFVCCC